MRLATLLLLIIFSNAVRAQSKFIEVTVSDTVLAKADLFIYQINIFSDKEKFVELRHKNPALYQKQIKQNDKDLQKLYDSVVNGLIKAGFTFLSPNVADKFIVSSSLENSSKTVYVMMNSVEGEVKENSIQSSNQAVP